MSVMARPLRAGPRGLALPEHVAARSTGARNRGAGGLGRRETAAPEWRAAEGDGFAIRTVFRSGARPHRCRRGRGAARISVWGPVYRSSAPAAGIFDGEAGDSQQV